MKSSQTKCCGEIHILSQDVDLQFRWRWREPVTDSESLSILFLNFLFFLLTFISKSMSTFQQLNMTRGKGFSDEFLCVSVNFMLVELD